MTPLLLLFASAAALAQTEIDAPHTTVTSTLTTMSFDFLTTDTTDDADNSLRGRRITLKPTSIPCSSFTSLPLASGFNIADIEGCGTVELSDGEKGFYSYSGGKSEGVGYTRWNVLYLVLDSGTKILTRHPLHKKVRDVCPNPCEATEYHFCPNKNYPNQPVAVEVYSISSTLISNGTAEFCFPSDYWDY
ncbi:MAG: hypothetical protein H6734_20570 [Alphaproteobacteria bacterium]|nr:hypothetical protein [Alphaproteobacteria bacterium]